MIDLAEMHSYFWLTSSRLKEPIQDDVPYTAQALRQDLLRVRNAWDECQAHRERDAIYSYLTAVFDLVTWWAVENHALDRARKALRLQNIWPTDHDEPFAAIIRCTADPAKVDKRTIHGLTVTTIESSGDYTGMGGPNVQTPAAVHNFRLLGAIVEGPGGNVFIKFTGPDKTVEANRKQFESLLSSFQKE